MASATVAAGIASSLLNLAISKGARRAELVRQSGMDARQLNDPDNRVPMASYMALMRTGQRLAHDPALALHFGEAFDLAEMSIVGLLGAASSTGAEMFAQWNRYERLVADIDTATLGPRHTLVRRAGGFWLVDKRSNPNDFPELTESNFARLVCMTRGDPNDIPMIKAVHVTHSAPAYRAEYDRIFKAPVTFDSDWNALLLPGDTWLHERMPQASPYVFGVLSDRAQALLDQLERSTSMRGRVESTLMPILHTGEASIDRVAEALGCSRQTIYRRLKAEGTTFQSTLDELRHKLALHYLGGGKASVNEIAYLVGFSDPAAFSRAFKRWTGHSPRAMRVTPGVAAAASHDADGLIGEDAAWTRHT